MRRRDLVFVLIAVTAVLVPAALAPVRAEQAPAQATSKQAAAPSAIPAPVPQAAIPAPVPQAAVEPAPAASPAAGEQKQPEQANQAPAEPPAGEASTAPAAATSKDQPASGAATVAPQAVTPEAQPASASTPEQSVPAASAAPQAASDPVVAIIRAKLADPAITKGANGDDLSALQSFYAARSGAPLFITEMGFTARGQEAIFEIEKADDWGLDAKAFDLPPPGAIPTNAEAQALAEIKLDLALLKYARHARGGRVVPIEVSELYDQVPPLKAPASVLAEIENAELPGDYLVSLQPKHDQFRRLHAALLEARGKPADEPKVSDAEAKTDDSAAKEPDKKDTDKKDAAKDAKDKKDVAKDEKHAKLGERDIKRLIVNMERWRWMPEDLGKTYVWNNSPEFMLYVIKDGKPIYADKILVGTANYATPVFTDEMETIVFNPDWIAPETVVKENLLPHLRAGNYSVLKTHKLSVSYNGTPVNVSKVDWGRVNVLSYTFLQKGGPGNNLGKIKFLYPNKHVVYMHDTLPVRKKYFKEKVRMIGHECVRMEKPLTFAEVLLAEGNSMPAAKVKDLWDKGVNAPVSLQNKLPVHMVYFTAVVDEKGKLSTFNDVYGLDRKLAAALFKDANGFPAPPPDKSTAAVVSASRSGGRSGASGAGGGFASSLGFIDN